MSKNETEKKKNITREILHIVEKLPVDFESCTEITTFCGAFAMKVLTIMDISNWPVTLAKNSVMHSFDITRHFINASQ